MARKTYDISKPNQRINNIVEPKIWIDLTDFERWSGTLTGIQRVIYNLCVYFSKQSNVEFFTYNYNGSFSKTHFNPDETYKPAKNEHVSELSLTKLVMRKSKTMIKLATRPLVRRLNPRHKSKLKRSYLNIHSQLVGNNKTPRNLKHPFETGDTVLILGASWAWENAWMINDLGNIKQEKMIKVVHLIYDMIPALFPQYFGPGFGEFYGKHMFEVMAISDRLLAISESTKKDVINFQDDWLLPKIPVDVIRLGDDINSRASSQKHVNLPHQGIKSNEYILTVGTIEIRKNHLLLYNVWKDAKQRGVQLPKLVVVGRPGWLTADFMYQVKMDPELSDEIIILSDLRDDALDWLYRNCRLTIYPSFYEGWGLPIAESLAYGKLCIPSQTSSMQEMAGDLLEYFNPYDTEGCLNLVAKYSSDHELLRKKQKEIVKRYKATDWEKTYNDTVKALMPLLKV